MMMNVDEDDWGFFSDHISTHFLKYDHKLFLFSQINKTLTMI